MTRDHTKAGRPVPAKPSPSMPAHQSHDAEDENQDPVGDAGAAGVPQRRVSEGDKAVGESDNDGSSPYEEPHHRVKQQRDQ